MLGRLEIGLAEEGVRLARAAPPIEFDIAAAPSTERVTYPPRSNPMTAGSRARRVLNDLRSRRFITDTEPLSVVHAWGEGCWPEAVAIGRQAQAPVVFEFWSAQLASKVRGVERRTNRGRGAAQAMWLCPCESLSQLVRRSGASAAVRVAPWGVHVSAEEPSVAPQPQRPMSVVIISTGADPAAACEALEGLAQAEGEAGAAMVFLDEAAVQRDPRAWRMARSLGMLDRLSVIADTEGRRHLILRTDMLIHPEARGEYRSIMLDAMAAGAAVVARRDPHVDALIDGRTAKLVNEGGVEAWVDALSPLLGDRESTQRVGQMARDHVRQRHRVSAQIAAVMEAYQWLTREVAGASPILSQG